MHALRLPYIEISEGEENCLEKIDDREMEVLSVDIVTMNSVNIDFIHLINRVGEQTIAGDKKDNSKVMVICLNEI